jgi:hypothetical protein
MAMNARIAPALAGAWLALAVGGQVVFASVSLGSPSPAFAATVQRDSVVMGLVSDSAGALSASRPAQTLAAFRQATPQRVVRTSGGGVETAGREAPFNAFPWLPLVTLGGLGAFVLRKIWLL